MGVKKGYYVLGAIVIVAIILIIIFNGGNNDTEESYKIGVVTSLSGNGANLGVPWVQGMQLAATEINNNGGINGKKIDLVVEDDKLTPAETTKATRYILSRNKVDVLTTLFEVSTQAMGPISNEEKIPMVTTSFSREILDANPYVFKINFDALNGCREMVEYAQENQAYTKLGVLMSQVGYNQDCIKGVKEVESNVVEEWYTFGEKDFRTQLTKLKDEGVDGIITVGIDFEYIAMFDQIAQLGYNTSFFCATASECIFNQGLRNAAKEMDGGVYGIDFFNPNSLPISDFASNYAKEYGEASGIVLTYSAIGYDEIYMLKDVFANCEPQDTQCIYEGMKDYSGSGGKIIQANGFNNRVLGYDYNVYKFEDDKWNELE